MSRTNRVRRASPSGKPHHEYEIRRGAMLPFLAICMVVIVGMIAFAVDVSYMHTLRAELRLVSDAAVRSGTEALRRTQSPDLAVAKAIEVAKLNQVGGRNVVLTSEDIQLGQTAYQADGSWKFVKDKEPFQALKVNVRFGDDAPNPTIPLFFSRFWGIESVAANSDSVATHFDQDIVLALDRSHSMCFDLTGVEHSYPIGTRNSGKDPYKSKPDAKGSRWASLQKAVIDFTDEISKQSTKPQLGLVTWASQTRVKGGENLPRVYDSPIVDVLEDLTFSYHRIADDTQDKGSKAMQGRTNMSAGMEAALKVLQGKNSPPLARKTMILMTDGLWNMGIDPKIVARVAADKGITIHAITFLDGTNTADMDQVAQITGGKHIHATSEAALRAAFIELARLTPVLLTD